MNRLFLPGLGCPPRIYPGAVAAYNPDLTLEGNAAAIRGMLNRPTMLVGHSMGGIVAMLVGGGHPVVNIEGLPDKPSAAAEQLAAGWEPTAASRLWRQLLADCAPDHTQAMARHYVQWTLYHNPVDIWQQVPDPKLYIHDGQRTDIGGMDIPGGGHFPMIHRPRTLTAVLDQYQLAWGER